MGLLRIFRAFTATGSPKVGASEWNADLSYSGELPVSNGGTGAATAAQARANLGVLWETVADWTPAAVTPKAFELNLATHRRWRVHVDGVKHTGVASTSSDLYFQVVIGGVTQSGSIYRRRHRYIGDGSAQGDLTPALTYGALTGNGSFSAPVTTSGTLEILPSDDCIYANAAFMNVGNDGATYSVFGGYLVNVGQAGFDGLAIGFATGLPFAAGVGSIYIEGLRR